MLFCRAPRGDAVSDEFGVRVYSSFTASFFLCQRLHKCPRWSLISNTILQSGQITIKRVRFEVLRISTPAVDSDEPESPKEHKMV